MVGAGGDGAALVMARVEERMVELASDHGDDARAVTARETISAGGKRLRPLLVCIAAGVPVIESEQLVRAAVAVELVHAATLVHDDVIDGADLRRGRPTVVATGGRLMALATGDLLFSRAFAELAAGGTIEPIRVLSAAASSLAAGELMQRADAWDVGVDAGALPRALPAEDRSAVPGGLRARRARRARVASRIWARSASGSGSPFSCSTTCSTSPARPSGPASRAAPTCSTAP